MTNSKTLLDAYRQKSKLPPGFGQVFSFLSEWHQNGNEVCDGFASCIVTCRNHDLDAEIVTTLLIGLQAVQVWYAATRDQYEDSKKFSEGNSRYAGENAIFVNTREQNNKFARRDFECRLILGYLDTYEKDRVEKKYFDPFANCVQRILRLPDYFERKMEKKRAELRSEFDDLSESDLEPYVSEFKAYHQREIAKRLSDKIDKFVKAYAKHGHAGTAKKRAVAASRKFFKSVHSSRTSVN